MLRLLFLISLFSFAECQSGSTYWEKTQNGLGLLRDLVFRVGHQTENERRGLQLISGGFPRTGTKSIEAALTTLRYRVYDSRAMVAHGHFEAWTQAAKAWKEDHNLDPIGKMTLEIERLGYSATLDIPMNLLAPALIQVRPDAKVLWNYRATGSEDWYESFAFISWFADPLFYGRPWTWILPNPSARMKQIISTTSPVVSQGLSYPQHFDRPLPWYERLKDNRHPAQTNGQLKMQWKGFYQAFPRILQATLRQVNSSIETQYLEYTVQEGWAPLLEFLQVEDPELAQQPFPHVNDRSTLVMIRRVMEFVGWTFPFWVLLGMFGMISLVRGFLRLFRMPSHTKNSTTKPKQQ